MAREPVTLTSLGDSLVGELFLPDSPSPSPALIICHGAGEYKENYFELCEGLVEKGVATLALDMHGHGASEGNRFHVGMKEWVADVRAALDFLETHPRIAKGRIGAFGLSSGGTAILETALVDPRLKALVALDATVRNSLTWPLTIVLKLLIFFGFLKKLSTKEDLRVPMAKFVEGMHFASDPEVDKRLHSDQRLLEAYQQFPLPGAAESFFVNTIKRVSRIVIPTLVIWGEDDELDPPETAWMLYNSLACKKALHIIPGNGHVGHLDRNKAQVFALTTKWALENLT